MVSFFDVIAKNKLKSLLLMLIFGVLFAGIVFLADVLVGGGMFGFAIGVVIVLAYAVFSYFSGYKMVLAFTGAKEADKQQYKNLYDIVGGLASAMQIPAPKIYIVNDPNPNAFATGRNRKIAMVAVTSGLLAMMDRHELEGVLSHEMSHIADGDNQVMMIAVVFAGVIGLISAYARGMLFWGFGFGNRRNGEGSGYLLLIVLVLGLLAPIVALLIRLAISRSREYMADANGARITRAPNNLASALKKIQAYEKSPTAVPVAHANEVTASLYFASPFKASSIFNLFSTHPPIDVRIKKLESMY